VSQKQAEPTNWQLEDVQARVKVCEKCGESVALNNVTLGEFNGNPSPMLMLKDPADDLESRFCSNKLRFGKPMESTFPLHALLGLTDADEVDRMRSGGENAIVDEFIVAEEDAGGWEHCDADTYGWTDLDWVRYLSGNNAEQRVRMNSSQSKASDSDEVAAKAMDEKQELLNKQAAKFTVDVGHTKTDLNHFVKHPTAVAAGLNRGHVLALRLFSSRMGHKLNVALHNGCGPDRPHPFATTVILLNDAVWKVRTAQIEERRGLLRKAAAMHETAKKFKDDGDDDDCDKATKDAKELEAQAKKLECTVFFRGVYNLQPPEFKQRGCTELGFMSVTKSNPMAKEHVQQVDERLRALTVGDTKDAEDVEEVVYLPLAPGWRDMKAQADGGADGEEKQSRGLQEIPIHMFKIMTTSDELSPANISWASTFPSDGEYVYAPGVFVNQGKITTEYMKLGDEDVNYKVVEVVPTLGANLSYVKGSRRDGAAVQSQDGKAATAV